MGSEVQAGRSTAPAVGSPPFCPFILDQRWSDLCSGLQELQMKFLDGSRDAFRSRLFDSNFGDLRIRRVSSRGGAHRATHFKSPVRGDAHIIWICMVLQGRLQLEAERHTTVLDAGDISLLDYAQNYTIDVAPPLIDSLWIGAPRRLIDCHVQDVDALFGLKMDRAQPATQMAWRVASAAFAEPAVSPGPASGRMVNGLLGILGSAFDMSKACSGHSSYRNGVLRRVKRYIEEHLEDDDLTVAEIARKQGVSTRYLAKLFQAEDQSVARWIWDRRLERCHLAMRQAQPGTTIAQIAYANGFKNLSHFCRAFKGRYGSTPGSLLRSN